jgi:hypothetical protein
MELRRVWRLTNNTRPPNRILIEQHFGIDNWVHPYFPICDNASDD